MKIRDMFSRDIDRKINGVIKIGNNEENKYQELEEYVVTDELRKYFRDFFDGYTSSINNSSREIGVWISGFYGSGKSHFMKILSYIIDNQEVNGKRPIDFFKDGKIDDAVVLANMEKAANTSSDVMLFNIESLSNEDHNNKDAILSVFLRAFNKQLGYDDRNPVMADFERHIDDEGKYELFKETYQKNAKKSWEEDRSKIKFRRKQFIKTVTDLDIMAEEDAKHLLADVHNRLPISVSDFAQMVADYCRKKGPSHRVIFLVDEIGQYIADDSQLLINLQTISEDFSTYCQGQAWIVVTSQQNIDEVTHVRGEDFSKIQARFNMRLPLSSSDVDEVIQKRILDKTDVAKQTLMAYYYEKESIIKNLIEFSGETQFKRKYTNAENFANVYPLIPYQMDLLGNVLTAVRQYSSSGKHLAEGERSMLALVQESSQMVGAEELGVLVSFNKFYDCLEKWIDNSDKNVIDSAKRNGNLEAFDVEVLKVLFMIKRVKEIKASLKDLTTLMVDHVDQDRLLLTKQVNESLKRLVHETYVHKEGELYAFLTNSEQELDKLIKNEFVGTDTINNEIRQIIFSELYRTNRFKYNSRYTFPFNKQIDDTVIESGHPIGLLMITPYNDQNYPADALRPLSVQMNAVIFKLPDHVEFQEDLRNALQIKEYSRKNTSTTQGDYKTLLELKQAEMREARERVVRQLEIALKEAQIFVNGNELTIPSKKVEDRINDALGQLVGITYNKLSYMETAPTKQDLLPLLLAPEQMTIGLSNEDNQLALDDLLDYIKRREGQFIQVNLKNISDVFKNHPYGFVQDDIYWLITKLYKKKAIEIKINGEIIQMPETTPERVVKIITEAKNADKLLISTKKRPPNQHVRSVNDLCKKLDAGHRNITESDELMAVCKELINKQLEEITAYDRLYAANRALPGKDITDDLRDLLRKLKGKKNPMDFYAYADDQYDDFEDLFDDFKDVKTFFNSNHKKIFEESLKCKKKADASYSYLDDALLKDTLNQINRILKSDRPYHEIKNLPALNNKFNGRFHVILDDIKKKQLAIIEQYKTDIEDHLGSDASLRQMFMPGISDAFMRFRARMEKAETLADPYNIALEANNRKIQFIKQIEEEKLKRIIGPKKKEVRTFKVSQLFDNSDATISNQEDLEHQLKVIKDKIERELEEGKIVRIKVNS